MKQILASLKYRLKYAYPGWKIYHQHRDTLATFGLLLGGIDFYTRIYGYLINAHPDALRIKQGCFSFAEYDDASLPELCALALWSQSTKRFPAPPHNDVQTYPQTSQVRQLRVLLDECDEHTVKKMYLYPNDISIWVKRFPLPVKLIYIVDSPYNFLAHYFAQQYNDPLYTDKSEAYMNMFIKAYFQVWWRVISNLAEQTEVLFISNDSVLKDTAATMKTILAFLKLEQDAAYLDFCKQLVFEQQYTEPSYPWTKQQIETIEELAQSHPQLKAYCFEVPTNTAIAK